MQNGGLRTRGITRKSSNEKPLITVITVVFNGEASLEQTIESVLNQTYDNVEYIIVDGGSKDRTIDIIKKYENKIDYWQSEPDKGIYDAMNKAIDLSNGKWINFMNAGDEFADNDVIKKIILHSEDIIYGDLYEKKEQKLIVRKNKQRFRFFFFAREATVCHQAIFAQKSTFENNKFDLQYPIVADRAWLKHSIEDKKCSFIHLDIPICIYDTTGVSSDLSKQHKDSMKFIKKEYGIIGVIYANIIRIIYMFYSLVREKYR